jgi:hypothetical protein
MSAPITWGELRAELLADCMREEDEVLTARLPSFIARAEAHFQRELFSPEREARATLVVASGMAALPADFGGVRTVWVEAPVVRVLEAVTPSVLRQHYPSTAAGYPRHFAIEGETMLIRPVPGDGHAIALTYIEGIPALGPRRACNWVLSDCPDLYVQAALAELYEFTEHYEKADRCRARRDQVIASINRSDRRRKTNSGPLVASAGVRQANRRARAEGARRLVLLSDTLPI